MCMGQALLWMQKHRSPNLVLCKNFSPIILVLLRKVVICLHMSAVAPRPIPPRSSTAFVSPCVQGSFSLESLQDCKMKSSGDSVLSWPAVKDHLVRSTLCATNPHLP